MVARAEWARLLAVEESLTGNDRAAVAAYCVAWERWSAAEAQVQKHGQLVRLGTDAAVARVNPFISIANQAHDRMVKLAGELRLTVVSRLRTPLAKARLPVLDAPVMELDEANTYALKIIDGGKA